MLKITNDGLTRSGTVFTQIATVGVKGLNFWCHPYHILRHPFSHPSYKSVEPPLQ